jgi:3'-5' exoribonuclease
MAYRSSIVADAGTAIEHTATRQLRGATFGPPLVKKIYFPMPITRSNSGERRVRRMATKQLVSELKPGEKVDSYFSVGYKKPVTEYKYGWMFEFRVADRSGQITAKYWGGPDKNYVLKVHDSFERDDVVQLHGEVADYRGVAEISVSEKNGGSIGTLEPGGYDVSDLIRSMENIPDMRRRLAELKNSVEEPYLRALLDCFFDDDAYMEGFASAPASIQLHSAAIGGLLHHTLNVAEFCLKIVELHQELDRDLVLTGALLHDIGKVPSFKVTSNITQTLDGNLLGHIILGDQELSERIGRIDGFPQELASKLRHILLSHHGRKDWGSPVEPMLPEALAVHESDDLDAKLDYMIAKRADAITEDDWIWDARLARLIYLR